MLANEQLYVIGQWSGYVTIALAAIAVLGLILKWGIRFRLVGITGFMVVLTGGIFALSLGLYTRPAIPGAVKFTRVFDQGQGQLVIAVPASINETQLEATLRQAAADLYSPGRLSSNGKMTIRARTVLHPEPGVSQLVYVGQVERSLFAREDPDMEIEVYGAEMAKLPAANA